MKEAKQWNQTPMTIFIPPKTVCQYTHYVDKLYYRHDKKLGHWVISEDPLDFGWKWHLRDDIYTIEEALEKIRDIQKNDPDYNYGKNN